MDNREFDNYLTLLSSLLRIRGEQRAVIAQELRAHLEDRLDDLLARGVDRDTAVQLALAEFGDAAGLAADFSLLVRNRRRRWFVKVTSFSTAVLVLLTLGVIAIWPEQRPGPAPARAIAQNPADVGGAPAARKESVTSNSQVATANGDGALADKLAKRITADFIETPLPDVLQFLSDTSDVQIFINRKVIENEGVELNTPITINLKNVRLDMLLDLVLEQASTSGGLTYLERDGILIVSTMVNLEGASEVRVYNCRDLLSMESPHHDKGPRVVPGVPAGMVPGGAPGPASGGPGGFAPAAPAMMGMGGIGGGLGGGGEGPVAPLTEAQQRAESLKDLIQTAVKPSSWSEVGGVGTISEYNGLIVINHDAKTHKQVENVLKMLREAAGLEQGITAKIPKQ